MKIVEKAWGREVWIVNCDKYCGKILELNGGFTSSYHYHKIKQETFYCLEGELILDLEGREILMLAGDEPVTIFPRQLHSFRSNSGARILEVSTKHDDSDVVRKCLSYKLKKKTREGKNGIRNKK